MSVVACRVYDDRIEIAADSIIVRGWGTQEKGANQKFAKLSQVNGLTIGSVGTMEEAVLFRMFCQTRRPRAATCEDVLDFLVDFADWKDKKTGDRKLVNGNIVVYDGRAFFHDDNYCVAEVENYEAHGAGFDYALAAMYLGHSPAKAVETACELSIYCERPIVQFTVPT